MPRLLVLAYGEASEQSCHTQRSLGRSGGKEEPVPTIDPQGTLPPLLTPVRAIRAFCLLCRGHSYKDVRQCYCTNCPLHEYRLGCRPKGQAKRTPLKAIRAWWLWSMRGSAAEVRRSEETGSPIWVYRFGKRPKPPSPAPDEIAANCGSRHDTFEDGGPFLEAPL
jgi:hypothetical protein